MFDAVEFIWHWNVSPLEILPIPAQVPVGFSGINFLVTILAGTLMVFAFQFLLTNFSIAVGISSLGTDHDADAESWGGTIRNIENKVGFWALLTASIALFAACFLAVKLSLIQSAFLGAIIGVVIWSTYFTLVVWVGSSTVGSWIGSFINTTSSGLQALMGSATSTLSANVTKKQAVATAEEITAAVRRELTSGLDADSLSNTLQNALKSLPIPKLDVSEIRSQFDKILGDVDWQSIADSDFLQNINRQTFIDLISDRTNLSTQEINQIVDQLEDAWKQSITKQNPTEKVINLLKSATPEELNSEKLGEQLQQLVTIGGNGNGKNGVIKRGIQLGLTSAAPAVLERVNLSEIDWNHLTNQLQKLRDKVQNIDVEKITHQLQEFRDQTAEQIGGNIPATPYNNIKADVKDYILNSFPWHFNRITIKDEFQEVIYDAQADPSTTRRELAAINQDYLINLLSQRGDVSEVRVQEIAQQMESVRQEVLELVQQAEVKEQGQEIRVSIENYLRSTEKKELNAEAIEQDFSLLLTELTDDFADVSTCLAEFDHDTLKQVLLQRQDLQEEEASNIIEQLQSISDRFLNQARERQEQATAKVNQLWQRIADYLRNTNKEELNPEGIRHDLTTLLEDPTVGISLIRQRLSHFDRDTWLQLLNQREDLSEEEINQILDQLEAVRNSILQVPQAIADQYEHTTTALAEYLRNTNLEELNPEGIKRDLTTLLADPRLGALALRDRLSHIDRDTLVKLVSQRRDLSEEQVNQLIDQVQAAIQSIVKAPRRLASRAAKRVEDFAANVENYLRYTDKEELNPESIKRDLQLLLQDPQVGLENLSDRLAKFDRDTLVGLLSQREDISEAEANQIVNQIESVRNSVVNQMQQVQQKVEAVIEGIFGRLRDYLNSLERPELNYEGLQQDFGKLFDDPQVGLEALRDRLSHFDRDTLVAILSSREDISPEDANRIINQIEAARDSVLHQAERIQQETQKRLQAIQEQAKKQVEGVKKTVARAAWWLFGTAFTSLVASAVAGILAVNY